MFFRVQNHTFGLKQELKREKHTIIRMKESKEKDKRIVSLEKGTKKSKYKTKSITLEVYQGNVSFHSQSWNNSLYYLGQNI